MSSNPALIFNGQKLACLRGERLLFKDISFSIEQGKALVITGENGSGKSSLLRIAAGLLRPFEGDVTLQNYKNLPFSLAVHYLGHQNALRSALTARENLMFLDKLIGIPAKARPHVSIDHALKTIGIVHVADLPVAALSAGQKRRVALAGLLISNRPVWILDEPTGALDTSAQAIFSKLVAQHCSKGGIVLAATHLPLGIEAQELKLS